MQPVLMEIDPVHVDAVNAEGMDISVAYVSPIDELDTELEGRVRLLHELGFVQAEDPIEVDDVGDRGLADADRADLLGFDERDRHVLRVQETRKRGCGHPSSGTAAGNDDVPQERLHIFTVCSVRDTRSSLPCSRDASAFA